LNTVRKRDARVLTRVGKYFGDSLIAPSERASAAEPLFRAPTAPDLPSDETHGIVSAKPVRYLSRRTYSQSQAPVVDATVPAVPVVPPNAVVFSDDRASFGDRFGNWSASADDARSSPAPEPRTFQGSALPDIMEYVQYLNQVNGNHPQVPIFDPGVPVAPFDASDPTPFSGGLLGRLAAISGIDPQNPAPQQGGLLGLLMRHLNAQTDRSGADLLEQR
jgi:hypothetical protein